MPVGSPVRLFISYSHKDQNLREALADHLASLQREGVIDVWHDRQISAGQDWAEAIDTNLEAADIVLCLVSAGFLASSYCGDIELKRALERHAAGDARVIPVILKPADWNNTPWGVCRPCPPRGGP
ncbi:MAG: toll/interleukin-1 receptor domain-containing protein [Cyanobium sp.]